MSRLLPVIGLCIVLRTTFGQEADCISDLQDLNARIFAEYDEVVNKDTSLRIPPYRYTLCPDTVFVTESEEDTIVPLLDQTFIVCGDDGDLSNNCIIEDGIGNNGNVPQVRLDRVQGHERLLTVFSGITFRKSFGSSVDAFDVYPMTALFLQCYWKKNKGFSIINLQREIPDEPTLGREAMIVQVENSMIENEAQDLGEDEVFDKDKTPLTTAIFNRGGTLELKNVLFRSNTLNYFVFTSIGSTTIKRSKFIDNNVEEGIFAISSFVTVEKSLFMGNSYVSGSLSIADASLTSKSNRFEGNSGLADVVTLSLDRESKIPFTKLVSSCFVDGNYLAGPVMTAGRGTFEYTDIFVDGGTSGDCTTKPFRESKTNVCFDSDGFLLRDRPCVGKCDNDISFSGQACALTSDGKEQEVTSVPLTPAPSPPPSFSCSGATDTIFGNFRKEAFPNVFRAKVDKEIKDKECQKDKTKDKDECNRFFRVTLKGNFKGCPPEKKKFFVYTRGGKRICGQPALEKGDDMLFFANFEENVLEIQNGESAFEVAATGAQVTWNDMNKVATNFFEGVEYECNGKQFCSDGRKDLLERSCDAKCPKPCDKDLEKDDYVCETSLCRGCQIKAAFLYDAKTFLPVNAC